MKEITFEEQPFRVLRVVPLVPVVPAVDGDESAIAFVDLVHVENNLIFPDCELYPPEGAYVRIPDSKALLQYHVQGSKPRDVTRLPTLPWQVDDEVIRDQTTVALNHFLGIPRDPQSFVDWTMNSSPCLIDDWADYPRDAILDDPFWKEKWAELFDSASHFNEWALDTVLGSQAWWEAWVESHETPTLHQALAAFVAGEQPKQPE